MKLYGYLTHNRIDHDKAEWSLTSNRLFLTFDACFEALKTAILERGGLHLKHTRLVDYRITKNDSQYAIDEEPEMFYGQTLVSFVFEYTEESENPTGERFTDWPRMILEYEVIE